MSIGFFNSLPFRVKYQRRQEAPLDPAYHITVESRHSMRPEAPCPVFYLPAAMEENSLFSGSFCKQCSCVY